MDYYGFLTCKSCGASFDIGLVEQVEVEGVKIALMPMKTLNHFKECLEYRGETLDGRSHS